MMMNKLVIIVAFFCLTGCAVNHVEEVETPIDAISLYKVPVIYGIGLAKDSPPIRSTDPTIIGFDEYDPVAKVNTLSCLGSADIIRLKLKSASDPNQQDHDMHYHVLMVPPGYYAFSWMGITPQEAKPSIYIKIENNGPQYLGDFWVIEMPSSDPKHPSLNQISTLPVEYHPEQAKLKLQSLDIPSDQLQQVQLLPTNYSTNGLFPVVCFP